MPWGKCLGHDPDEGREEHCPSPEPAEGDRVETCRIQSDPSLGERRGEVVGDQPDGRYDDDE